MPVLVLVILVLVGIVDFLRHRDSRSWSRLTTLEWCVLICLQRAHVINLTKYWFSLWVGFTKYFHPKGEKANPWQYHIFRINVLYGTISDFHFCIALSDELALTLTGQPRQELFEDRNGLPHRGHLVSFHIPLHLDGHYNVNTKVYVLFYLRLLLSLRERINLFDKL